MNRLSFWSRWISVAIAGSLVPACDNTEAVEEGKTALSLAAVMSPDAVATPAGGVAVSVQGQDLEIARARVVVRRIKLKPVEDDVIHEFSSPAQVVEIPLDGSMVDLAVSDVPPGRYDRVEIRVHRVDPDDPTDAAAIEADPEGFADFIAGERHSVIVDGTFQGESFTFRGRENDDQEIPLNPPIEISEGVSTNVTLTLAPEAWFLSPEGTLLDPNDEDSMDLIDENFKQSIEAFRDDDHDALRDD